MLKDFNPFIDSSTSEFLREYAISMEKRDISRTYLAFSYSDKTLLGFITISMKCISLPEENLLSRNLLKQCNIDDSIGVAQAYLLGQIARSNRSPKGFGNVLIDYAIGKVREAKGIVGCRVLRLDCANGLITYYEKNGFTLIRKNLEKDLNQMIIIV